ncbi:MAG: transporter [Gammaproteobacteria bacterium]|nr:transporter [Gammaproteobacteria bacterium]
MALRKNILQASIVALLSANAYAGGLAISIQSATDAGTANASNGATGQNAAAAWTNPAAMMDLDGRQYSAGGTVLKLDSEYTDQGSTLPAAAGGGAMTGDTEAELGGTSVIPSFYYASPWGEDKAYGVAINAPYGVSTEYGDEWTGRYLADKTDLKVLAVSGSVAKRLNDKLSIGGTLSAQFGSAELTSQFNKELACFAMTTLIKCLTAGANDTVDGTGVIEGKSTGFGASVGATYQLNDATRIGAVYRSAVDHEIEGDAKFDSGDYAQIFGAANVLADADIKSDLKLPAVASVSVDHIVNEKLTVHGDVTWTEWSRLEELRIDYDSNQPDTVLNLAWEDTVRVSGGATYRHDDLTTFRVGVAKDPTPTPSAKNRTPRAPSEDATWLSVGMNRKIDDLSSVDLGLTYISVDEAVVDYTDGNGFSARGLVDSTAWAISAQYNRKIK